MSSSVESGESANDRLLAEVLDVVRRRWRWIAAVLVAVVIIAALDVARTTPMYRSTATISVSTIIGTGGQGAIGTVAEQVELLRGTRVREAVLGRIGSPATASFEGGPSGTVSVRLSGVSTDPARAALIATTYAEVFAEVLMELDLDRIGRAADVVAEQLGEAEQALDDARASGAADDIPELDSRRRLYVEQLRGFDDQRGFIEQGRVGIVETAEVPASPYDPRPGRALTNALAIGLVLGLFAAFVRDYFDDRLDTLEAVERHVGRLPVLGTIPLVPAGTSNISEVLADPGDRSAVTESYRAARTSLQFLQASADRRVVQITSSTKGDGKSTSVAHLAISLARTGQRVLVVDLDLRSPRQHQIFGLDSAIGFTTLLVGDVAFDRAVQEVPDVPGLSVLTSGQRPPDPSELLAGRRARALLADLTSRYDVVLVDSPPVLPVSDPAVIAAETDGTLLVIRVGTTRRGHITSTISQLERAGATLLGVIVVGVDTRRRRYGYSYGYGYGDAPEHHRDARGNPDGASALATSSVPPSTNGHASVSSHEPR